MNTTISIVNSELLNRTSNNNHLSNSINSELIYFRLFNHIFYLFFSLVVPFFMQDV